MVRASALVLGIALVVVGAIAVGFYLAGLVDMIVDQPADRSWIFWGSGFAGFGAVLMAGGVALLIFWRTSGR